MPGRLRRVLGTVFTAGLCYGAWWLWMWAEKEIKGTPFGDFKFFGSVLAVFALLSLVQVGGTIAQRLFTKIGRPSES